MMVNMERSMPVLPLLLLALWLVLLYLLNKTKMGFFKFVAGAVGMFGFTMYYGMELLEKKLEYLLTLVLGFIGSYTALFTAYPEYSMLTVYHKVQALSFFIDYECSGFVETAVFASLVLFYPVYGPLGRLMCCLAGVVYIFGANIARVLFICLITRLFGPSMFFFSHTVFARVLFFVLMIILYYRVFTKPHILLQKVGRLYNAHS